MLTHTRPAAAMLLGFILAAPAMAFADVGTVALTTALQLLAPYTEQILIGLGAALLWGLVRLVLLMKAGTARHWGLALIDAGKVGAKAVEQKVAPALRDAAGKLDAAGALAAKAAATAAGIDWLRTQGFTTFRLALGLSDPQLEAALGVTVEAAVHDLPSVVAPLTHEETAAAGKLPASEVKAGLKNIITTAVLVALALGAPFQVAHADGAAAAPVVVQVDGGAPDAGGIADPIQLAAGAPAPVAGWLLDDASAQKIVAHEAKCTAALDTLGETSNIAPQVILAGAGGLLVGAAVTVAIVVLRSKL